MKSSKKVLALALALAMAVTAVPATTAEAATTGVPKTKTYYAGKSYTLTLTTPKTWKSVKTTWSEKNSAISLSSKKTKSVKVKAIKATKKATVKCKVTYKKSTKKGAKRYTKNYVTKIVVKNPTLSVKAAATTLTVGETAKLTVKKTPSSATVKYSSSDDAVASVSKGVISANGVGTAIITTKLTCGSKTVSKNITVKVTEAVTDGITATLTNQFDPVNYPNVVVTNPEINKNRTANLRVYYGKNGKGVNDRTLVVNARVIGTSKTYTMTERTDANGIAYFPFNLDSYGPVNKVEYTITADDDSSVKAVKETIKFAEIGIENVLNVNGYDGKTDATKVRPNDSTDYKAAGYAGLTVSENDIKGTTKGDGLTESDGTVTKVESGYRTQYTTEFVDSQQVSPSGTTKNQVGFVGGTPYIKLPGDDNDLNNAKDFTQDVNITSGKYDTYANDSKYITLNVSPEELTYATLNFTNLTLSKYTRLEIESYKSEADAKDGKNPIAGSKTSLYGPTTQNSFSYQIPLNTNGSGNAVKSLCVKVTLKSQGQVDTATNLGYTIKDITGVYKDKKDGTSIKTEALKGAKVVWSQTTPKYGPETPLSTTSVSSIIANKVMLTGTDTTNNKDIDKVTYRVPVFPYAGNAIITTYDKNGEVIAYYACPTKNNGNNENVLDTSAHWLYRISQAEAFTSVGTVSQATDSDLVTVNSDKAGITYLEGKITGLDNLFDATNNKVYTSVQWNPVENASAGRTGAIAFAGQEVTVTAQLVDSNNNAVTNAGTPITFKYYDESNAEQTISTTTTPLDGVGATTATVLDIKKNTDSKGQATLKLSAAEAGTAIQKIQASTSSYNVVITVNGVNVDQLDVYWIEAKPAFGVTASDKPAGEMDKVYERDIATGDNFVEPNVGENWEYAFKINDVTLPDYGTWAKKSVSIKNAKIDITVDSASKGTVKTDTGINGMVTATSNVPGKATLTAKVDGTEFDKNGVVFKVGDTETKSIGTGTTCFSNKQKLEINWKSSGLSGAFINVNGVNAVTSAAADFALYFKVADKYGNANTEEYVTIKSSKASSIKKVYGSATAGSTSPATNVTYTDETTKVYADKDGIIKIELDKNLATRTANEKEMITVTLNGVPYTQTITWKNPALVGTVTFDNKTVNGQSSATTADPFKSYADNSKIVLTFDKEILGTSVIADQFIVGRQKADGSGYEKCEIGSVTVSGKSITITLKYPITDGVIRPFVVKLNTATVNGVAYTAVGEDGAPFDSTAKYFQVYNATSATAPSASATDSYSCGF